MQRAQRKEDRFPAREDVLNLLIKQHFSLRAKTVLRLRDRHDESVSEIFQITKKENGLVSVSCLYEDIVLERVVFPRTILDVVRKRDVFMMTLGRRDDIWKVIWMSLVF